MKVRSIIIVLLFTSSLGWADLSCDKADDVDQMVKEVYTQLFCSSAKNWLECADFAGVQGTAGGALAAVTLRGLNRTLDKAKAVCGIKRGTASWWPLWVQNVDAADCSPDFKVASEEAEKYLKDARRELYYGINQQDREIQEQMRRIRETAEFYEHKGAPDDWPDWRDSKKIDSEYKKAILDVDRRSLPTLASGFEELVLASDESLKGRGSELLQKFKSAAAVPGNPEAYARLDDLMDLYAIRRPVDRTYLNPSSNPLVAKVESAFQERVFDLSDHKRVAYQKLEKLPAPQNGGPLFLEYSAVEKYELSKLSEELRRPRSRYYPTASVPPAPGNLPNIEVTYFRDAGYAEFERRFPLLMEEPRVRDEVAQLRNQAWRMSEIAAAYNAAQDVLRGAKHVFTSMDGAKQLFAGLPRMPEGSTLALQRQILQEKFENLRGGKGWQLSAEAIKKFSLQEAVSGGAKLVGRAGLSVVGKAGVLLAGPFGVAAAWAETAHSTVGLILPDSVNCQKPCSEYLNYDEVCKAKPVMNSKSQAFLKLKTEQQMAEIKKCPAMCDQLKGLYAQASPTLQWQVQCSDQPGRRGYTLKSKDKGNSGRVTFEMDETPTVRFDQVSGLGPAQLASIKNGEIASVRVPKRGGNTSPEVMRRRNALSDPGHFYEVTAAQAEKPSSWFEKSASEASQFFKSIQYAAVEANACCAVARGERSLEQVPGRKRCEDYGVKLPAAAGGTDSLKVIPAKQAR